VDAPYLEAHVHRNSLGEQVWCVDDAGDQSDEAEPRVPDRAAQAFRAYRLVPRKGVSVDIVV
jgi:hypothetical protein